MSKLAFGTRASEGKSRYTTASRSLQVSEDIVPIAELKSRLGEIVRGLDTRPRPLIITLNGKAAAVVMSPRAYDRMTEQSQFVHSIQQGLADAEDGRVIDDAELGRRLERRRAARRRKQR
jgi:prevent-host-death family protein